MNKLLSLVPNLGGAPRVQRRRIFLVVFVAMFAPCTNLQPGANAAQQQQQAQPPEWTTQLTRQLQQECQEDHNGRSCFSLPIGGKVLDLVPLGEVSEGEKAQFWARWEGILQPEHFPKKPTNVIWRKLLLTKVSWAPRKADATGWGPPTADWICAKWDEGGHSFVAIGNGITVKLKGPERITYRHPRQDEVPEGDKDLIIESQIDKPGLYNLLLTLFKIPWQSEEEFVIRWPLVNRNPDRLQIRSLRLHREPEPPHWREWFDDFTFDLSGTDPQYLTFGFWVPPKR